MPATRRGARRSQKTRRDTSITVRISGDVDRRIQRLADRDPEATYSSIVRIALEHGLAVLEAKGA
jgi:predicted transcriptional regulator